MRRKREAEHDNKERWLVSYADFITLLFAFFVVMYSVSSVNEGKYKVLSETLDGAFNASQRSITPIEVGEHIAYNKETTTETEAPLTPVVIAPRGGEGNITTDVNSFKEIADQFTTALSALISDGLVSINDNDDWIEVSLRDDILFTSGNAEPVFEAFPVLEKISAILKNNSHAVLVEGFTDNIPIKTTRYPTNWELSSARAAAIVRMLTSEGIAPSRLAAIGYGEHQPVVKNDTPENRRKNRRVVLLISKESRVRATIR
ncbi:MAG: flagellar motor protein MotD [Hahellaceae bacterium]|jgi:chemotaxis protein MotB|nr:flagellar motor protein MotD [Hahellaceae bacterium]MCP5213280.1 flagellar motor protein MotD [Hahellaceae bacterium]